MKPFPWVEKSALIDTSVEGIIRGFSAR